jgi:hypothetical protein
MKKLLILLVFLLTACTTGPSFEEQIEAYLTENEFQELSRQEFDGETVVLYETDIEFGMVQFVEKNFETTKNSLFIEGKDVEILQVSSENDETYFGVIIRNQELFENATSVEISLTTRLLPVVFDLTGDYEVIMMQHIEESLTSCSADGIKVLNGDEVLYQEGLVPI